MGEEHGKTRVGPSPMWFVEWWFVNDESWVTIGSVHDQALPDGTAEVVQQAVELILWDWWNFQTTLPDGRYRAIVVDSPQTLPMDGVYEVALSGRTYNMVDEYAKHKERLQRERQAQGLR